MPQYNAQRLNLLEMYGPTTAWIDDAAAAIEDNAVGAPVTVAVGAAASFVMVSTSFVRTY